jgi:hypothetical protein
MGVVIGAQGSQGAQGAQGVTGAQGAQGIAGNDGMLTIRFVFTFPLYLCHE